ncbi:MAG: HslU--HslV peptidase ATPase subunit, partial [Balneolaceae bacterium]
PELQGRFPIRVELNSLTESDFFDILTHPKNALTKQYEAMLATEGVEVSFTEEAIKELARIAALVNSQVENIGARRLHTIMSSLFDELLFAVPDDINSGKITIDPAYVDKQLAGLVKDKDLSHYIL